MAGKGKKVAAALAAVSLYLQEEEAMAQEQQNIQVNKRVPEFSQWGQSGRQDMMTMRRLVQLRTFTRF